MRLLTSKRSYSQKMLMAMLNIPFNKRLGMDGDTLMALLVLKTYVDLDEGKTDQQHIIVAYNKFMELINKL